MPECPGHGDATLIDLPSYHYVPRPTRDLIRSWFRQAKPKVTRPGDSEPTLGEEHAARFQGFIYAWIAFNGWAMTVSDVDGDKASVDLVGSSPDLQSGFRVLLDRDEAFKAKAERFHALWPIFSDKDIRRSGVLGQMPPGLPRSDRIQIYLRYRYQDHRGRPVGIRHQPACAEDHEPPERIPLDWAHALSAIYQVRCNLFHGYKGIDVSDDIEIVSSAYNVLYAAIRKQHLLS